MEVLGSFIYHRRIDCNSSFYRKKKRKGKTRTVEVKDERNPNAKLDIPIRFTKPSRAKLEEVVVHKRNGIGQRK